MRFELESSIFSLHKILKKTRWNKDSPMEFLASSLDSDNHLPSKDNFRLKLTCVRICHGRLQHCSSFKKKKKEIETKPIEFARKRVKEREKRRSIERRVNFSLRTHREPREGGVGGGGCRCPSMGGGSRIESGRSHFHRKVSSFFMRGAACPEVFRPRGKLLLRSLSRVR